MRSVKVWDPLVRFVHWATALLFFANFTIFDDDSAIHTYAGYVIFGLVALRLLWGFVGTKYVRFSAFWPHRKDIVAHIKGLLSRRIKPPLSHNPVGAVMIFNLLATLVLISVTGIMLTSDFFHDMDWVEDLHEGIANYALICVGLHVAGVLFESLRSKVNLIKAMITGRKEFPEPGR